MHAHRVSPAAILALLVFAICRMANGGDATIWPGVEFAFVKAYLFGGDPMASHEIVENGNINPSVEKVARLTPQQAARIPAAIQERPKSLAQMKCYSPHHAFVYFDKFARPVAWINVCYQCGNYRVYPALPEDKILKLQALTPIFREAGIPGPSDRAFGVYLKRSAQTLPEESIEFKALFKYGPQDDEGAVPPTSWQWPWKKCGTVKLYEFNIDGRAKGIVHLGTVSTSVAKEVLLNEEQRRTLWSAFKRSEWEPFDAEREARQDEEGLLRVRLKGTTEFAGAVRGAEQPTLLRHGLVCFDEKGKPVAWLNVSFSDGTYAAHPHEGPLGLFKEFWNVRLLRKTFEDLKIPIQSAETYQRLEQEARNR